MIGLQLSKRFYSPRRPSPETSAAAATLLESSIIKRHVFPRKMRRKIRQLKSEQPEINKGRKTRLLKRIQADTVQIPPAHRLFPALLPYESSDHRPNLVDDNNLDISLVDETVREMTRLGLKAMLLRVPIVRSPSTKSKNADRTIVLHCQEDGASEILAQMTREIVNEHFDGAEFRVVDQSDIVYAVQVLRRQRRDAENSSAETDISAGDDHDDQVSMDSEEDSEEDLTDQLKKLMTLGQAGKPVKGVIMMAAKDGQFQTGQAGDEEEDLKHVFTQLLETVASKTKPTVLFIKNFGQFDKQKVAIASVLQQVLRERSEYAKVITVLVDTPCSAGATDEDTAPGFQNNPSTLLIQVPANKTQQWKQTTSAGKRRQRRDRNSIALTYAATRLGLSLESAELAQINHLEESMIKYPELTRWLTLAHGVADSREIKNEHLEHAWSLMARHERKAPKNIVERFKDDRIQFDQYEKRLLPSIVPPDAISTKFRDIACSDQIKESLQTLVALPLLRPGLFYGALKNTTSGVLLFGPPGTGKTLLAKAIAAECGSNFLSISASSIFNMYVGEGEKNAKAVFTLARKIAPCVVFVDEMDSMLDTRDSSRSYATKREIINEFMAEWDGLASKNDNIIVMGATNRPFDLDDAVLRRMPRRVLIDLPNEEYRKKILEIHLRDETLDDDINLDDLAKRAHLYSGSDLKNVCISAALNAVRTMLTQESSKKQLLNADGQLELGPSAGSNRRVLRPEDFDAAFREVTPSVSENQESLERLRTWDQTFGESAKRRAKVKLGFQ